MTFFEVGDWVWKRPVFYPLPSSCAFPPPLPPNPLGTAYLISWLPVIPNHLSVDFRHVVTL